jgi:hypothetical protein
MSRDAAGHFSLGAALADLHVAPHAQEAPFTLEVSGSVVRVLGTTFRVESRDGRLGALHVFEGRVELTPEGLPARTIAGGEAYLAPGVSAVSLEPPAFSAPWWSMTASAYGHLAVESEPSGAEVLLDGRAVGSTPLLIRWPAGSHDVALALGRRAWRADVELERDVVRRLRAVLVEPEPEPEPAPAPRGTAVEKAVDLWRTAAELLERRDCPSLQLVVAQLVARETAAQARGRAEMMSAECLLRREDRAGALAAFQNVVARYADTPSAEAALFETAKLEAELGAPASALATLDTYLRRFPSGQFAEAAHMRRCELLLGSRRLDLGRACLEAYRTAFPEGLRRQQALLLLANVERAERRWAEAVELYRAYLTRPEARREEEARYNLVECSYHGRLSGLRAAATAYLERFPSGAHSDEVRRWLDLAR